MRAPCERPPLVVAPCDAHHTSASPSPGGIYFVRATDASRAFFNRTLAVRDRLSAAAAQQGTGSLLSRFHCDDQPYLEHQLRQDTRAGRLRAIVFDTRLIQSDGQRPERSTRF